MKSEQNNKSATGSQIKSADEYRRALERANELRDTGATAESDEELALLEGAIAQYVNVPGQPDQRKGRPAEDRDDS